MKKDLYFSQRKNYFRSLAVALLLGEALAQGKGYPAPPGNAYGLPNKGYEVAPVGGNDAKLMTTYGPQGPSANLVVPLKPENPPAGPPATPPGQAKKNSPPPQSQFPRQNKYQPPNAFNPDPNKLRLTFKAFVSPGTDPTPPSPKTNSNPNPKPKPDNNYNKENEPKKNDKPHHDEERDPPYPETPYKDEQKNLKETMSETINKLTENQKNEIKDKLNKLNSDIEEEQQHREDHQRASDAATREQAQTLAAYQSEKEDYDENLKLSEEFKRTIHQDEEEFKLLEHKIKGLQQDLEMAKSSKDVLLKKIRELNEKLRAQRERVDHLHNDLQETEKKRVDADRRVKEIGLDMSQCDKKIEDNKEHIKSLEKTLDELNKRTNMQSVCKQNDAMRSSHDLSY